MICCFLKGFMWVEEINLHRLKWMGLWSDMAALCYTASVIKPHSAAVCKNNLAEAYISAVMLQFAMVPFVQPALPEKGAWLHLVTVRMPLDYLNPYIVIPLWNITIQHDVGRKQRTAAQFLELLRLEF